VSTFSDIILPNQSTKPNKRVSSCRMSPTFHINLDMIEMIAQARQGQAAPLPKSLVSIGSSLSVADIEALIPNKAPRRCEGWTLKFHHQLFSCKMR